MTDLASVFNSSIPARRSIRTVLFDVDGEHLLFHGVEDPDGTRFFTTFGGGVEGDETPDVTLTRELWEELDATAVIGPEVWALPSHRYFLARVTALGAQPFTHGPEYATATQRFWVERVTLTEAVSPEFNLQPAVLRDLLAYYEPMLRKEIGKLQ